VEKWRNGGIPSNGRGEERKRRERWRYEEKEKRRGEIVDAIGDERGARRR